jgi:fermentation-respiration switch protein FrsA (DUF1100 family)
MMQTERLELTQDWDKTFPRDERVDHEKVTFVNRYGITLAADLYRPRREGASGGEGPAAADGGAGAAGTAGPGRLAAIAVSGPFGAVKEQASGLYAQEMAARGFLAIAFDPSFTGESSGQPRRVASPDINTEDFCAAVDYLSCRDDVDPGRIGVIGICGFGGMAINAAALDPRIRATAAMTMYDMSRVTREGYFGAADSKEARDEQRRAWAAQRTADYEAGTYLRAGGVVDPLPDDAPQFVRDYHDYYKTPRGYHERSGNSTDGWNVTGTASFMNQPLIAMAGEIDAPVLLVHGEKAHSRYFSEGAFAQLRGDNKELVIVPGANHVDLYDNRDAIPFDRLEEFFERSL